MTTSLFAYEDSTHKSITENAISTSGIATYLENIGIKNTDEFTSDKFPNANLWCLNPYENTATGNFTGLIVEGNRREDCPVYRSGNHFYDPTTGSKLTDGINTKYSLWSALERVTGSGNSIDWLNSGPYKLSWIDAKDYYYSALTLTNKDDRNKNWGNLFLSIGNILHLIQDMASPAHVRNDSHGPGDNPDIYEDWSNDYTITSNYSSVNLPKLTDYWDAENGKGLAEFTNSNFFSRDTNVDNTEHQPQYSKPTVLLNGQEYQEVVTDADGNSETVIVKYGLGTVVDSYTNTSYSDTRLTAYSLWDFDYRKKENGWVYSLNDTVHQTYADYLIPRAVGYSAGLLDYFFRGDIDMDSDPNTSGYYIIKNLSNENMSGIFSLYYDDANDNRHFITSWDSSINAGSQSSSVTFTTPINPAPKEIGKYILIFQGTFGNETGAVVGKEIFICSGPLLSDYTSGVSGSIYYEEIQSAYLLPNSDGTTEVGVSIRIKQDPSPSPYMKCFWLPWFGCWWYWYYPADPYSNNWDTSGPRYNSSATGLEYVKVWIDYDGDKIFSDSEIVMSGYGSVFLLYYSWPNTDVIVITGTIILPVERSCLAVMRVALRWPEAPNSPSGGWTWGEVKDFQVVTK